MVKTLLIPDIHGDGQAAVRLMQTVGALDADGERTPGWKVIQTGDIVHGSKDTKDDDSAALALVEDGLIDLMLVGNHDYPFVGGGEFGGYQADTNLTDRFLALYDSGRLRAAHAHGTKLVTHAGLTPSWRNVYGWTNAYDAAKELNELFREYPLYSVFGNIGWERGGILPEGGILWSDWREPRWLGFNQIHGHSVGPVEKKISPVTGCFALRIDNGGGKGVKRLAGAILEGSSVTVVYGDPDPDTVDLDACSNGLALS